MKNRLIVGVIVMVMAAVVGITQAHAEAERPIRFQILNTDTRAAVSTFCSILDASGEPVFPAGQENDLPFFYPNNHFSVDMVDGTTYTLRINRGPEWVPVNRRFIPTSANQVVTIGMTHWLNLRKDRWFCGDLETAIQPASAEAILRSQGVNVACRVWDPDDYPTEGSLIGVNHFKNERTFSHRDLKLDSFNIVGLSGRFWREEETPFSASQVDLVKRGHDMGAVVEVTDPFSPEVPIAVGQGWVDLFRMVGGPSAEWGTELEEVMQIWDEYYRYLNAGFELGVSAGSGAAERLVEDYDRLGFARVYGFVKSGFSYGGFMNALKKANSWATSGPLLAFYVNGKIPGRELRVRPGDTLRVSAGARSLRRMERLEIVQDGRVIADKKFSYGHDYILLEREIRANDIGWLAIRAYESRPTPEAPLRYAHSSPVFIRMRGRKTVREDDMQHFVNSISETIKQIESDTTIPQQERETLVWWAEQARTAFLDQVR